jgi:3-(3-hydroxy-phenyl)propionate hydroxylase
LTAARLLARHGVESLVLDRWESVYPQPRAVHLDDEIYRILARMGLGERFAEISRPCHGLRLVDADMRVLAEFRRGSARGRHGFPEANMFDQPELERLLRTDLPSGITLRGDAEVTAIVQDCDAARVEFTDLTTGRSSSVDARCVLGCDGANSLVRASIGATMRDLGFAQRWLVVDVATDADLGEWEGVHQVCDQNRAATYMRIGQRRYRWEFRLAAGETAEDYREIIELHPLIEPWTKDIPVDELELVRVAEYTFHAQIADRWRDRRVFLLGDAAHLTPPFIGQGMGAGLRDAANLAWKLAGVLDGTLPESFLDTYQTERKPHARALIRMAKLVGRAMTEGGELGNVIRHVLAPRLHLLPGFKNRVLSSVTPALRHSSLAVRARLRRGLSGTLCPNAVLTDGRRFDDLAAGRFAVVTSNSLSPTQRAAVETHGAAPIQTHPGDALYAWLRRGRVTTAVVRPDGTVLHAGRDLTKACAALPACGAF